MNVARPLKGKGIADSGGKDVVLGIVLKLFREFDLCSLAVFEFVRSTGGGSDKIAKVWHERVVEKGYEDIRAEARCRAAEGVIPGDNSGSISGVLVPAVEEKKLQENMIAMGRHSRVCKEH